MYTDRVQTLTNHIKHNKIIRVIIFDLLQACEPQLDLKKLPYLSSQQ